MVIDNWTEGINLPHTINNELDLQAKNIWAQGRQKNLAVKVVEEDEDNDNNIGGGSPPRTVQGRASGAERRSPNLIFPSFAAEHQDM